MPCSYYWEKKNKEGDQPLPNIVQLFDLQAKATIGLTELANTLKLTLHLVKNKVIIYELDNLATLHLL